MNRTISQTPPLIGQRREIWRPGSAGLLSFGGLTGIAALLVLYFFEPSHHSFYPICVFHAMTGWDCPGCGTLRGLHQLLHGNLRAAWRLNALLVVSLPIVMVYAARIAFRRALGLPPVAPIKPAWLWCAGAVLIAFGILRNLPVLWVN